MHAQLITRVTGGRGAGCTLLFLVAFLFTATSSFAQAPQPGLAGTFEIDGNLISNSPGGIVGLGDDWLDGPPGPGSGVLNPDGTPKVPGMTFHLIDRVKTDADVFARSTKVFGDPNTYLWKAGSAPQKDDIQNGMLHLLQDANGQYWITVAGDRKAITGNSYIDYEFLQNTLLMNEDGTFTSFGPHGGRTIGDLLLTIELGKGGDQAQFFAQTWVSDGNGGYMWSNMNFPVGAAYVAANTDSTVQTSFDAFGSMTYDINQFGEAAVNLNYLIPNFGECFGVATVFVRTKSSTSEDAVLKDFIEPYQINMCFDTNPPQLNPPADITISCAGSIDPATVGAAFASDDCASDPTVSYEDTTVPDGCGNSYTIYRKWKATDDCGNVTTATQVITVTDKQPPVILSGPADVTVECTTDVPAPDGTQVIAEDDCGTVRVNHVGDASSIVGCVETITRTYRVDDGCGNAVDYTHTIKVQDTTQPTLTKVPEDLTVECITEVPGADISVIGATDNCGNFTVTHVGDDSNNQTCGEVIKRTYKVTDDCGNATTHVQTITVDDKTPPVLTKTPDNVVVDCSVGVPEPDTKLIEATDNCSKVTVTHVDDVSDKGSCPETIKRTYSVKDECGNETLHVQLLTVDDDEKPTITSGPADISVECGDVMPAADTNLIKATDNCGSVFVSVDDDVITGDICNQMITRTYRATDICGNEVVHVQKITVKDTTDPAATPPGDVTVQCAEDVPAPDGSTVSTNDNCGTVEVTHVGDASDGDACTETIMRTYRATDQCGNYTEVTQKITVKDTESPTITKKLAPVRVQCTEDVPPPTPGMIGAIDNCSDVEVKFVEDASDGETCPETITRTYRVSDACMNSTDVVQTITIHDDTPPTLSSCASDDELECPSFPIGIQWPTATDNCDDNPEVVIVASDSTVGPEPWTFRLTRTWQAFDDCGNASSKCTNTLTVHCEVDALCTLTQGFWGNYGGKFNYVPTLELIKAALSWGPLVVGKDGDGDHKPRGLKVNLNAAHCIIERLPGGTTPTTLPDIGMANMSHRTCQTSPPIPVDSEGKFENVLLGQTIALTLNTRLSPWLPLFPLTESFCTQKALPGNDGLFGTEDDYADPEAPVLKFFIPVPVLEALDNLGLGRNVGGLLELANRGLAAWDDLGGATLSEINDGVDAINRGFDGCRFIVDCAPVTKSFEDGMERFAGSGFEDDAPNLPTRFDLGQNYPNPFNPTTRITLAVPVATDWTIGVYNVAGQLVRRFDGATGGAAYVDITWDGRDTRGRTVATGVYFYRVQAGSFRAVKKMVLMK